MLGLGSIRDIFLDGVLSGFEFVLDRFIGKLKEDEDHHQKGT
jgi:hypothetical protein